MSVDFEWCFLPTQSPSEPTFSPHKSFPLWLAVFVPSKATEVPAAVANIAYPTKATNHSRLEVEIAQVVWFWIFCLGVGDDRNLFRVFCKTGSKSATCSGVFIVGLWYLCAAPFERS